MGVLRAAIDNNNTSFLKSHVKARVFGLDGSGAAILGADGRVKAHVASWDCVFSKARQVTTGPKSAKRSCMFRARRTMENIEDWASKAP